MKPQPALINIFFTCHDTVQLSLAGVTAFGKIILLLLMVMCGVCYCAGLNGGPNDVIHYSVRESAGFLWASRELFPKLQSLLFD